MAGLAGPNTALAQHNSPDAARPSSARRSLPDGPCNYRDAAVGCGCGQFWDKLSADLHDDSVEHRPSSARSTWCVCGHHACFHLRVSRAPEQGAVAVLTPNANWPQSDMLLVNGDYDAQHQLLNSVQLDPSVQLQAENAGLAAPGGRIDQSEEIPSQASTSGLPRIPSMCLLSYEQRARADKEARHGAGAINQSRHTVTGLGLSMMHLESAGATNRQQSQSPTIPDDISIARDPHQSFNEPDLSSTRAGSIATEPIRVSPSRGLLDPIVEFNRNLLLDVPGDTIPNTFDPNEFIQSATEVATPSLKGTPDLRDADRAVKEGKQLIGTLTQMTSNSQQSNVSPNRPTNLTSAPSLERGLAKSPSTPREQLQNMLQTGSPQTLQKLVSYLAPLHNLLNTIPNVASTMRDLGSRLDMLENGSFNYVAPEDLNHTLTMYEDRLVDLEHRVDQHDIHRQTLEADQASHSSGRRHIDVTTSFGSNHSLQSTTSSALILAAMDRKDTEVEIGNIKDRLDVLEAAALPSTFHPWEVEVVLLPWGRDLRGIWFSPDEPMHDASKPTTQESEEWTQARVSKAGLANSSPSDAALAASRVTDSSPCHGAILDPRAFATNETESGWSSQAISDWASGSTEDWLFPKACGSNNMVYKRLQSRGFIRNITLRSANARDLQIALSTAFGDLLEHLSYTDQDGDTVIDAYPGLRASFIPLRKVMKESKLRFLTPAEMSSSALWSAQFLAAGVIMRVSGGRKRLYVTQRESYIQRVDDLGSSWTWQELRQLPRYQEDQDSQMQGNDTHCQPQVPEADAKEPCWQFFEAYDAPAPSLHSSFDSHDSVQLSMRPADRQWRRSITPSSILKNRNIHPISPLSELHPRPYQLRNRTASAPIVDQVTAGPSKRRFQTSPVKQSSAPQSTSRTPSASVVRLKRRRTSNSDSSNRRDLSAAAQVTVWNATPRRSREPPSPYPSSLPHLPRSNSDVASRPSQRSIAIAGKSTPFAYATPHSGPVGFGAFNNGGDTEPDDDDDDYDDGGDDGEQSWPGVTDGDDASSSVSSGADQDDAQFDASFSGDDSGFGSHSEDDDDDQSDTGMLHEAQRHTTTDDDEEDGDVFDTLLDVLEH